MKNNGNRKFIKNRKGGTIERMSLKNKILFGFIILGLLFSYMWFARTKERVTCGGDIKGKTVLLMGDSLAGDNDASTGLKNQLQFLVENSGGKFVSDAVGGTTTDFWTGIRTAAAIKKAEQTTGKYPSVILISLGINDAAEHKINDPETLGKNIAALLNSFDSSVPILWIGPPRWPPSLTYEYDAKNVMNVPVLTNTDTERAKNIILQYKTPNTAYFDSQTLSVNNLARMDGDGHPDAAAYTLWANAIWDWCKKSK